MTQTTFRMYVPKAGMKRIPFFLTPSKQGQRTLHVDGLLCIRGAATRRKYQGIASGGHSTVAIGDDPIFSISTSV